VELEDHQQAKRQRQATCIASDVEDAGIDRYIP